MRSKAALVVTLGFVALGCAGSGGNSNVTTLPTPDWTITANSASSVIKRSTTSLGTLFDAGSVTPGQTVSSIKFSAVAMNGYDKSVHLGDVASSATSHVTCVPSASSVTPSANGTPFTVSFSIPANYPYAGSGAQFEGTDPDGNKKTVGITFKVQTVSGTASKGAFRTTDLSDPVPITITPINGFTGTVKITFDRTIQSSDGVPAGYMAPPPAVAVSAISTDIPGSSPVTANASFTWTNWAAGNYAIIAVLSNGTMAIRVPIEVSVAAGSGGGQVGYSPPTLISGGNGATIRCVSPGGKMAGTDGSGNLQYWATSTSTPVPVSSNGLGAGGSPVMTGINDSGQMAGNGAHGPCYWTSPTSDAAYLKMPAGYNGGSATSINAAGNIVGNAVMSGDLAGSVAVYWSSPTATPVVLSNTFGGVTGNETISSGISNSGAIFGSSFQPDNSRRVLYWNSITSDPVALNPNATTTFAGMNQATGAACGWSSNTPYVWSPSSYAAQQYAGSGFLIAVGSDGVAVGSDVNQATALVWTSPTAQPVPLSTLVQALGGWTLQQALFITTAGDVIGSGQTSGNAGVFVVHRTK